MVDGERFTVYSLQWTVYCLRLLPSRHYVHHATQ